jgi:16S rRNA C1402 (ribose-2'-O) methylase RsmI
MGRELTKAHEELAVRPISAHLKRLGVPRGEYTVVIAPKPEAEGSSQGRPGNDELATEFGELTNSGLGNRREILKLLSEKYDIPTRELYSIIERHKNSGQ